MSAMISNRCSGALPSSHGLVEALIACRLQHAAQSRRIHHTTFDSTSARRRLAKLPSPHSRAITTFNAQRRSASTAVTRRDDINPPESTLPPFVAKVEKGNDNVFAYLWKVAKTFGSFYKAGGKAIFTNRKLATEARERIKHASKVEQSAADAFDQQLITAAVKANAISRADFQLLRRHGYDFARLPIFGVLIIIMGEWLPLIVPFMPYAVPLTCRIPSQIEGMRKKSEERRGMAFRQGVEVPGKEQLAAMVGAGNTLALADAGQIQQVLQPLSSEQIWYLSCVLNLHGRIWETIQQRPPSWMLRRRLAKKLQYLAQDDTLLQAGSAAAKLAELELLIACEERGMDVLKPSPKTLEEQLKRWLNAQKQDGYRGASALDMLFRRPNSW